MAYSKQTWNNGVTGGTPINAARLNHMEDGIENPVDSIPSGTYAALVTGLDVTGGVDGTAIIQAALDSGPGVKTLPPNATIKISDTLVVHNEVILDLNGSTLHNVSTTGAHSITNAAGVRKMTILNGVIDGDAGSGDGFCATADFGGVRLVNLRIPSPGRDGVNIRAGNGIDLYMEGVRVDNAGRHGFNLDASGVTVVNTVTAISCYSTGATQSNWVTANISIGILTTCSGDNAGAYGFSLGGNIALQRCSAEANTSGGFAALGAGNMVWDHLTAGSPIGAPYQIAANANVYIVHISDTNNLGTNSLVLTAAATGRNVLVNHALTKTTSLNAAANLIRGTGDWGIPRTAEIGPGLDNNGQLWPSANRGVWLRVRNAGMISKIALGVAVQSGNICVAVYRASGFRQSAKPGTLLASSNSVACPAVGYAEVSLGATIEIRDGDFIYLGADNNVAKFWTAGTTSANSALAAGVSYYADAAFPAPASNPTVTTGFQRFWVLTGVA